MFSTNHPFLFLGHRFLVNSDHQSCHPRIVLLIVARNAGEILANQVYFWCQYIGHLGVTLSVLRVWPYIYDIKCLMVLLRSVCCFEVLMLCLFPYSSWEYGVHFKGIHFNVFKLLCLFFSKPVLLHHYTFYNLFSFYKRKANLTASQSWPECTVSKTSSRTFSGEEMPKTGFNAEKVSDFILGKETVLWDTYFPNPCF